MNSETRPPVCEVLIVLFCVAALLTAAATLVDAQSLDPADGTAARTEEASSPPESNSATPDAADLGSNAPPGISPGASADPGALAREAANPAAPLTQIQLRDILVPSADGADGPANVLQLQPVVPIGPFAWLRELQLVKITFEMATLPGPLNESGFGDLSVYDLVSIKTSWGRWGVGPVFVFPTAASDDLGAGKYQVGLAAAAIFTRGNLTAGAVFQNQISIAGDSERPEVNQMTIAPTLTYNIKNGWFAGLSDFSWSFDWEDGGAATIPLGVQVGKILRIGKQPVNLSVEVGRAVARPSGTPDPGWIIGVEVSPLFNWHLGPGHKVKLRGKK